MRTAKPSPQGIDLAAEPDFHLGVLLVSPSTGRVGDLHVEPRVMQVLVVLARATGSTVTRESLVLSCWAGRAISEDAVARVIAKVRQLARNGNFVIETIPKIGFRLLVAVPPAPQIQQEPREPRGVRVSALVAAAIVAVTCIGLLFALALRTTSDKVVAERLSHELREGVAQFLTQSGMPPPEFTIASSVRADRNRFVASIAIRDSRSGSELWSNRSTLRGSDLAGADEEIGDVVATTLQCTLDVRNGTRSLLDTRQLSLLMNACSAITTGTDTLGSTQRLIQAAPMVPGAHALRAIALAFYARSLDRVDGTTLSMEARNAAARGIELNPDTALAHLALGLLVDSGHLFRDRQQHLLRALELNPNLMWARVLYTRLLQEVGQPLAASSIARLIEDSSDHSVRNNLPRFSMLHAQLGEHPDAERLVARLERINSSAAASTRWTSAMWWEHPTQITARVWDLGSLSGSAVECLKEYLQALEKNTEKPLRGLPASCGSIEIDWRVRMLAREGDLDGAYELIKSLPLERTTMFLFYPEMKAFRADARFGPLAERLGLLAFWRETQQWPDSCATEQNEWCRS